MTLDTLRCVAAALRPAAAVVMFAAVKVALGGVLRREVA